MTTNFAPRTVAWMIAAALATGWTGSSLLTPEPVATVTPSGPRPLGVNGAGGQANRQRSGARASVAELPERLHSYTPAAPLPNHGRNPFVYGARPAAVAAPMPDRTDVPPPVVVTEPPPPAFRLTGVASALEDGMQTLTAIITVNGSMTFVKAGGELPGGYTVQRVDETSVLIADATGATQTLKLP